MSESGGIPREIRPLVYIITLGAIVTILDGTIVNVALDTLGRDFDAPLATLQWFSTAFLLALATVIPLTGWACDRFGTKRTWTSALGLFVFASALCAAAWSAGSLIAFRALQGFGAGMVIPAGQAAIVQAAGRERLGHILSAANMPLLIAPVLGPLIGGAIVDNASWRWIFLVNLPIGVGTLLLARRILPSEASAPQRRLDVLGLLLLSPGVTVVVFGLAQLGGTGSLTHAQAGWCIAAGVLLVAGFVVHALRAGDRALIDVRLFAERVFSASAALGFIFGFAMFSALLILPLYYQTVRGASALQAGLLVAPQGLGSALALSRVGKISDRLGAGRVAPIGLGLAIVSTFVYTQVGPDTSYVVLGLMLVVRGIGLSSVMTPAWAAAYATLERRQVPRATAAQTVVQRVGGSIGGAVVALFLQERIRSAIGARGVDLGALDALHNAALAHAFGDAMWLILAVTVAGLPFAFRLPRKPVGTRFSRRPEPRAALADRTGPA